MRRSTAALTMFLAVFLGAVLALAALPAAADPGHAGGVTLVVTPRDVTIDLSDPAHVPIAWEISNATGHALTVHGFSSPRAAAVHLLRRRALLGQETWQPVDFLRLEGGETVRLESPDYVLSFDGLAETAMTLVLVTLSLGPDGEVTVGLVEPLGP